MRPERAARAIATLRIFLAFAYVPAGLKKVLGEPFAAPGRTGPFYAFLDAFHATGGFYRFVGVVQLVAAGLLVSQRAAGLGTLVSLPVLTAIVALCWSTGVYPTATVTTAMWLGTVGLLRWDSPLAPRPARRDAARARRFAIGGVLSFALYLGLCAARGEVYRPLPGSRGPEMLVFPMMLLAVAVAWAVDARGPVRPR